MSLTRQVAHNTIYQLIGKGITALLSLAAIGIFTRYLGQQGFGSYITILAFLQFFGIIADFGLTLMTVQMISETEDETRLNKILSNVMTLRTVSAAIFLTLAPLSVLFLPYSADIKTGVAVASLGFFFIVLNQTLTGLFQKKLRMDKPAIAEASSRVIFIALAALCAGFKLGLYAIMISVTISNFAFFLMTYLFSRKYVRLQPAFDWEIWKETAKRSWPIAVSIIFNLIYLKADIIILSLFKDSVTVGLYGASYKVVEGLTVLPMMFMGIILPLLARTWAKTDTERFKRIFQKTLKFLILVSIPMVVGTFFVGEKIMVLIAGREFTASGEVLKILMIGTTLLFLGALPAHAIIALGKQKIMAWGYVLDAAISLLGYLIFIPKYSYLGAAWITVFSQGFIAVLTFAVVYKTVKIKFDLSIVFKSLLSSCLMALFLFCFSNLHILLLLAIAPAIYGLALLPLRAVSRGDIYEIVRLKPKPQ